MRKKRNSKNKNKKIFYILIGFLLIITTGIATASYNKISKEKEKELAESKIAIIENKKKERKEIVISAAGDCVFGTDTKFGTGSDFISEAKKYNNDYSHFMKNVKHIFEEDDFTIVNLEAPFTESTTKAYKGEGTVYHFKSPLDFVNILKESSIEGVSISNNHIYDYGQQGYNDTVETLKNNEVEFCGEGHKILIDIKGVKFGFLAYQAWNDTESMRNKIQEDINSLRAEGAKVVIPYFHWGIERDYKPYSVQQNLGRFSIDAGADMVLGAHPHVMQSIEEYKGKLIAYSLGNFSFGGNFNPSDKRTFIIQSKFEFLDDELQDIKFKVIPTMISSVTYRNDYVPTPATGDNKSNIFNKLNEISETLEGKIGEDYFSLKDLE